MPRAKLCKEKINKTLRMTTTMNLRRANNKLKAIPRFIIMKMTFLSNLSMVMALKVKNLANNKLLTILIKLLDKMKRRMLSISITLMSLLLRVLKEFKLRVKKRSISWIWKATSMTLEETSLELLMVIKWLEEILNL
jgi:hypothetical protein